MLTDSAVSVSRFTGRRAVRLTAAPSAAATATPPIITASRIQRSRLNTASTSSNGRTSCKATPLRKGAVSTRTCVPAIVVSYMNVSASPRATASVRVVTGTSTEPPPGRVAFPDVLTSCK